MKKYFLILFLFLSQFSFSQMYPSAIYLKSGDSITRVIGRIGNKEFKYKEHLDGETIKIPKDSIYMVKIHYSRESKSSFRFLPVKGDYRLRDATVINMGNELELYTINNSTYSGPGFNSTNIDGSQNIAHSNVANSKDFYVKKRSENRLTYLGHYQPLFNEFKKNMIKYFSDCDEIINKIETKKFKMKKGAIPIVDFYNNNCGD